MNLNSKNRFNIELVITKEMLSKTFLKKSEPARVSNVRF